MSTVAAVVPLKEARRLCLVAFDELSDTPFTQASVALVQAHLIQAEAILALLVADKSGS